MLGEHFFEALGRKPGLIDEGPRGLSVLEDVGTRPGHGDFRQNARTESSFPLRACSAHRIYQLIGQLHA